MILDVLKLKDEVKELKDEIKKMKEEMVYLKGVTKELLERYNRLLDEHARHISAYYASASDMFGIVLLDRKNKIVFIDKDKMFKDWTVYYLSKKPEDEEIDDIGGDEE